MSPDAPQRMLDGINDALARVPEGGPMVDDWPYICGYLEQTLRNIRRELEGDAP